MARNLLKLNLLLLHNEDIIKTFAVERWLRATPATRVVWQKARGGPCAFSIFSCQYMETRATQKDSPLQPPVAIYVAEDDPQLKDLTAMLLASAGHSFLTFESGEKALETFRAASVKPHLVISDFSMGARLINGVQFLTECKRLSPSTKAFLVSGTVEEKDIRVDGNPVDWFMSKPFKADQFLSVVQLLLSQTSPSPKPPQPRL